MPKPSIGAWIWNLSDSPEPLITQIKSAGCGHVLMKVSDGTRAYNSSVALSSAAKTAQALGLHIWAWGYNYLLYPEDEGLQLATRAKMIGANAICLDLESEIENYPERADNLPVLLRKVREIYPVPVFVTSYDLPSYHPKFPWAKVGGQVAGGLPQVYQPAHRVLKQSVDEYVNYFKTVLPVGPMDPGLSADGTGTVPDMLDFLQHCWDDERISQASLWTADHATPEFWAALTREIGDWTVEVRRRGL